MFRPMLATSENPLSYPKYFKEIVYPVLGSFKYDGIRAYSYMNRLFSRTSKLIPSSQAQLEFGRYLGCDGELIEGEPTDFGVYNRTQSYIMSAGKIGDISYHVFDYIDKQYLHAEYIVRYEKLKEIVAFEGNPKLLLVEQRLLENEPELLAFESEAIETGYEGIILRNPLGFYKQGRTTWKEMNLFKLKRFEDLEGIILGFSEGETNLNEAFKNELGYTARSTVKDNMVPSGRIGTFHVGLSNGEIVDVSPGVFTHDDLSYGLRNPEHFLNKCITFRHFPHGRKEKRRQPYAVGFRNSIDM